MLKRLTLKFANHRHLYHLKPSVSAFILPRPSAFSIYPTYLRHFSTLKREELGDADFDNTDPYSQAAHDSSDDEEFNKILELNDLLANIHNQEYFDESSLENKVVKFMALYSDLSVVISQENEDMVKAMNEFVSPSLITF